MRLGKKLLVATSTLLLVGVAAEIGVRRYFPLRELAYEIDDELLYRPLPGARRMSILGPEDGGGRVISRFNDLGLRGPRLGPKQGTRVAVYGDSFVSAENLAEEETFTFRLGVRLEESLGRPVEVLNAGVTGYGVDQEVLKFEREAELLDPDLVLLVLCGYNDFGDLCRDKLFRISADGALEQNPTELDPRVREHFASRSRESGKLALWSAVRHLYRKQSSAPPPPAPYIPIERELQLRTSEYESFVSDPRVVSLLFQDGYDADVSCEPDGASSAYKRRLMSLVIQRFKQNCEERGIGLVLLFVPAEHDVAPSADQRAQFAAYEHYAPSNITGAMVAIANDLELAGLDLFEPFAEHTGEPLYFTSRDIHWTALGNDLAARLMTAFLVEGGLL